MMDINSHSEQYEEQGGWVLQIKLFDIQDE